MNIRSRIKARKTRKRCEDFLHRLDALPDGTGEESWQKAALSRDDSVQAHTDKAGNAYFIGDAYKGIDTELSSAWKVDSPGPYLQFIKRTSTSVPRLEYLAHWMEVSTSPTKWKFVEKHPLSRAERASRVKACILDYSGQALLRTQLHDNAVALRDAISVESNGYHLRLIIAEDLSRDLIETLGTHYDIDPRFFRGFISDYMDYHPTDPWVELPSSAPESEAQSYTTFSFLRARYFDDKESYHKAEVQTGMFNVLRRLDSEGTIQLERQEPIFHYAPRLDDPGADKGAMIASSRSKTAMWTRCASPGRPLVAIMLVDPTVTPGFPLWGGIDNISACIMPSTFEQNGHVNLNHGATSLFDLVVDTYASLTLHDIQRIAVGPRSVALPACRIVIQQWDIVIEYVTSMLSTHWPYCERWRRNQSFYRKWVEDFLRYVDHPLSSIDQHNECGNAGSVQTNATTILRSEVERILRRLSDISHHIQRTTDLVYTERADWNAKKASRDSHRSMVAFQQSRGLSYLSILATVFLPLNFATSFFSMSSDFSTSNRTFWLFFAFGVPFTVIVILIVIFLQSKIRQRTTNTTRSEWLELLGQGRRSDVDEDMERA